MQCIIEAKDVLLYKKILNAFFSYSDSFPMTGIDKQLDMLISNGKKSLPTDKIALNILDYIFSLDKTEVMHKFINFRFSDLPSEFKPRAKCDDKIIVCFWCNGKEISDYVHSLVSFEDDNIGFWCDCNGVKCKVIQ